MATSKDPIDGDHWIDPEVVELAGISAAELERLRRPADFTPTATPVAQPPVDLDRPQMAYPPPVLERLMGMADDDVTARMSLTEPPVP